MMSWWKIGGLSLLVGGLAAACTVTSGDDDDTLAETGGTSYTGGAAGTTGTGGAATAGTGGVAGTTGTGGTSGTAATDQTCFTCLGTSCTTDWAGCGATCQSQLSIFRECAYQRQHGLQADQNNVPEDVWRRPTERSASTSWTAANLNNLDPVDGPAHRLRQRPGHRTRLRSHLLRLLIAVPEAPSLGELWVMPDSIALAARERPAGHGAHPSPHRLRLPAEKRDIPRHRSGRMSEGERTGKAGPPDAKAPGAGEPTPSAVPPRPVIVPPRPVSAPPRPTSSPTATLPQRVTPPYPYMTPPAQAAAPRPASQPPPSGPRRDTPAPFAAVAAPPPATGCSTAASRFPTAAAQRNTRSVCGRRQPSSLGRSATT